MLTTVMQHEIVFSPSGPIGLVAQRLAMAIRSGSDLSFSTADPVECSVMAISMRRSLATLAFLIPTPTDVGRRRQRIAR